MAELHIGLTNTGPVPDNQCALKDAVLFAAQSDEEFSHDDVVDAAQAFYAFLTNPAANTSAANTAAAGAAIAGAAIAPTVTAEGTAQPAPTV